MAHLAVWRLRSKCTYGKGTGSANANLCSATGFGNGLAGTLAVAGAGCNNDWSNWGIGSRTQWDVTKTFYLGVEVLYSQLNSASTVNAALVMRPAIISCAFGGATVDETRSNWAFTLRAHRDFLP